MDTKNVAENAKASQTTPQTTEMKGKKIEEMPYHNQMEHKYPNET